MNKLYTIFLLLIATHLGAQPTIDIDADNDGLIEVNNLEILDAMRYQLDGSGLRINATAEKVTTGCAVGGCKGYELTRDLDFLDTSSYKDIGNQKRWTNGAGWQPIGDSENPFTAIFKTNNSSTPNTIFNLMINRSDEDNVGLFGRLGHAAQLSGIGLLDIQVTGRHRVGGLVGENVGGQISNSYASGRVTGNGGTIGLLVGSNRGAITNSYADGEVSGKANSVGGLVGMNSGNISNSYAVGSVAGSANNVGGLVGDNSQGVISNSYASSHVSGSEDIGGLVGLSNLGTLIKNYVSGKASGIRYVGGLVGMNIGGTISHSYWDKTTSALNSDTGGVGLSASELQSASAQSEDLKKPFYQWSTAHWDFGNETQYPILKYATGADADNPACGPGPSLPNCGSLLLGQHASLKNIVLLADATLTPKFKPTRFNYHLNITPATKQLQIIPIATNPNVVIDINKNGTAIETDLASGTTSTTLTLEQNTQLTIAVSAANQRSAQYQLTVNYLPEITVTGIPQYALDEGRRIMLSASSSDAEGDVLSYRWHQNLGKALAFDATDQPILVLRIPEDYVSVHASGAELELTLAVSDGKANISQAIRIDINKIDNGTITVAAPTSGVVEWTASEVKLADDPDGVGNNLQYQWQSRAPDQSSDWIDIAQATQRSYTPSILTAVGTEYRVRLSYTDGQGYATTVHSKAAPYEPEIVKLDFVRGQAMPPTPTPAQTTTATSESDCGTANPDQITDIDKDDDGLIEICNLEGLDAMRYQLDGSGYRASADAAKITAGCAPSGCSGYELMRDLDFLDDASYRNTNNKVIWTTEEGWQPIGKQYQDFKSSFEGNGYTISHLMINRPNTYTVGLFRSITKTSRVTNISLLSVNVHGYGNVGSLVGSSSGTIMNSYATVAVTGYWAVGGLVGSSSGTIMNSYTTGAITGHWTVGGLVGSSYHTIMNSYATGAVTGHWNVGGLVGYSYRTIMNSYATGAVTGRSEVGGLVGYGSGIITNSYATGAVTGHSEVGGLVGSNDYKITNSYATGVVTGRSEVGGLVGYNSSDIMNSYATGAITGLSKIGGLVGYHSYGNITNSYWDMETSGIINSVGGIGKTTVELQSPTEATGIYDSWSSWDFGNASQYPILKVNSTLLSPALRYGLKEVRLVKGHLSPDFISMIQNYTGSAVSSSSTIQLIPIAVDPNARIHIMSSGIDETINSGDTSSRIQLNENNVTNITITVTTGVKRFEYNLSIDSYHFAGVVDKDSDGLIEIDSIEKLRAINYQLDGTGYRAGGTFPKIMLGCPPTGCIGYELTKDLSLAEDNNWLPISYFSGTFEGNGNTISNLKINRPNTDHVGLFGAVLYQSRITNIGLLNVNVQGDNYVGGLVGFSSGNIINSYATGAIVGRSRVGGLVGSNYGNIMNSYATDAVAGRSRVGGLVGSSDDGNIMNSYATGAITGDDRIGGLVGSIYGGNIINSYATGTVRGNSLVGGLVGYKYHNSIIRKSYWDTETSGIRHSAGGIGKSTVELQSLTEATGIYSSWGSWDFGNDRQYPVLKKSDDNSLLSPALRYGLKELQLTEGHLAPNFASIATSYTGLAVNSSSTIQLIPIAVDPNARIRITSSGIDDMINSGDTSSKIQLNENNATNITIEVKTGVETFEYNLSIDYYHFAGVVDKDSDGLIEIDSIEKLRAINYQLDGTGYRAGETTPKITEGCPPTGCIGYELTKDLSLAEANNWLPISYFSGTFEGNGNTISNLKINRTDTDYVGLFGIASYRSRITNISLLNVTVQGNDYVGGLIGYSSGDITHSYATGTVRGSEEVGGLVGDSDGKIIDSHATGAVKGGLRKVGGLVGDNNGEIMNSYATSAVTGRYYSTGGLVGNNNGKIINSYATGAVTGRIVGGLAGDNSGEIINSYATVAVKGDSHVGGLVGLNRRDSSITKSYATGAVTGNYLVGGLVGSNYYSASIKNSYWDKQTSRRGSSRGGIGKTTAQLQSPTDATEIYSSWSTADWDFGTTSQYPAIKYAEHCGAPQQPTCGTLLPGQYPSLLDDLAVNGALSPRFDPAILSYGVTVKFDVDNLILQTTATGSTIRINSSFTSTVTTGTTTVNTEIPLTIAGPTIITITVTKPRLRPTHYQLSVLHDEGNPKIEDLTAQGRVGDGEKRELDIREIEVSEGQTFEVSFEGECKSVCGWEVPDELASLLDNEQHGTDNLIFREVPADFVDLGNDYEELDLKFTTRQNSGDYAGNKKNSITVIILKTDNGDISVERPTLNGRSMTAPDGDPDGGVQENTIQYQWQQAKADNLDLGKDASWENIEGATAKSYTVPESIAYSLSYRVQISYTDGQGYGETVNSQPIRDIDADDDGLIEIKYLEELDAIRHQLDGSGYRANSGAVKDTAGCPANQCIGYELVADLDFNNDASYGSTSNKVLWTEGGGWFPIGDALEYFNGTFKGNGYTISNLRINRGAIDNVGLFYEIGSGAKIDSIDLYRVRIIGHDNVGSLVGSNLGGRITNSNVSDAEVIGNGDNIGGLVGFNSGIVSQSYASVDVKGINENMGSYVGGLVGDNHGSIINSYATGTVNGIAVIGGLTGRNRGGSIENSYARAEISEVQGAGGLVGRNDSVITNSYWETRDDFMPTNNHGIGLSAGQLQSPTTATGIYSAWDVAVWDFGTENQYPALKYHHDECTQANPPNNCDTLLAGQRVGLQSIELSHNATLLGELTSDQLNYTVLTTSTTEHIQITPTAAFPGAEINIENSADHRETTITVMANKRTVRYVFTVEHLKLQINYNGMQITGHTLTEGTSVELIADVVTEHSPSLIDHHWSQSSDGKDLLASVANKQLQKLNFIVAADYVESNTSSTDVTLRHEVTVDEGERQLNLSTEVTLTINKRNDGTITTADIGNPSVSNMQITAPDLSGILSLDPDGESATPAISYQWQRLNDIKMEWNDIQGSTISNIYQVPGEIENGIEYRVLISYTDGQGHERTIESDRITFIDIDRDNDGLIDVRNATDLDAIRHQLDGYRLSATATSISLGCPKRCEGYELQDHIDLSGRNWQPLGSNADPFDAILEGNHYTISNLSIDASTMNNVGLFAVTLGTAKIRNIGLLYVEITANSNVGGIVGHNKGTVNNSYVVGNSIAGQNNVGALIGFNSGTVSGTNYASKISLKKGSTTVCGLIGSEKAGKKILGSCPTD